MFEARGSANHGLIDFAARGRLFLLAARRAGLGLGILGAIRDLLEQIAGLAFIREGEANETLITFEGVEEGAILIVLEALVKLMLPDDSSGAFKIDHFEVEGRFGEVADESDGAFNASVAPLRRAGISSVNATNSGSDDLVAGRGDGGLDFGFVRGRDG